MSDSADDRVAIDALLWRYGDAVNRRDAALWGATWDEAGEWQLFDPEPVRGRDAIVAAWDEAMALFPFVVMSVTPGPVTIDGDRAEGRSYTDETARTADGRRIRVLGAYEDRYRKRDGAWSFAFRKFTILLNEDY